MSGFTNFGSHFGILGSQVSQRKKQFYFIFLNKFLTLLHYYNNVYWLGALYIKLII